MLFSRGGALSCHSICLCRHSFIYRIHLTFFFRIALSNRSQITWLDVCDMHSSMQTRTHTPLISADKSSITGLCQAVVPPPPQVPKLTCSATKTGCKRVKFLFKFLVIVWLDVKCGKFPLLLHSFILF